MHWDWSFPVDGCICQFVPFGNQHDRDEAVANLSVMQQQNERLRNKYFRDLNAGKLSEYKEKFPPHPISVPVSSKQGT